MGINVTEELLEKIDYYLKGNLSSQESINFRKEIDTNPELKEIVMIQEGLFEINDYKLIKKTNNSSALEVINHYREQIDKDENQKLFSKIKEASEKYKQKNTAPKNKYLYYAAASIALLFTTIFFLNSSSDLENVYKNNSNWDDLPSYVIKSDENKSIFSKGEQLFRNNEFAKSIEVFKTIRSSDQMYPYALMYIGAAYERLNENKKSLETFDQIIKTKDFIEYSRGYWYKLLVYSKQNNKEKAEEMKKLILQNPDNYNYDKVKILEF